MKVWRVFCDCFNCLPIAAVVSESIICMHRGVCLCARDACSRFDLIAPKILRIPHTCVHVRRAFPRVEDPRADSPNTATHRGGRHWLGLRFAVVRPEGADIRISGQRQRRLVCVRRRYVRLQFPTLQCQSTSKER